MLGHNRRMTGAECLAEMLGGYGVTHIFMVPAVLRRTFAEMERRTKIARIHCHGEKSAAYMADGSGCARSWCAAPSDRKSTRLNSSHANISYAVFCLKKKNIQY